MKVLTLGKIKEFVNLIKKDTIPTEEVYRYGLQGNEMGFFIPHYEQGKSFLEVYKNGLRLCQGEEYAIDSYLGKVELTYTEHTKGDELLVIHKKYN